MQGDYLILQEAMKLVEQNGIQEENRDLLANKIFGNRNLLEEAIRRAAEDALWQVQRRARAAISGKKAPTKVITKEMQESVQFELGKFLNWPLRDGSSLGKANRDKVESMARFHRGQGNGHYRQAYFYEMVGEKLNKNTLVEDVYSDAELEKLYKAAGIRVEKNRGI